jgi:DNA-binding MarR family transcriptional regulator
VAHWPGQGFIFEEHGGKALAKIDPVIHQSTRLRVMASLGALEQDEQVDFVHLRKILELTDGNLGAHLAKLETAGYVKIEKMFIERRPRTFIKLTGKGRDAFEDHVSALREIIGEEK